MEGTIKITAISDMGVSVDMNVRHVSYLDMMGVFDALAKGFKLDKDARRMFGLMFAMGGIDAMPGVEAVKVEASKELLDMLKRMRENGEDE